MTKNITNLFTPEEIQTALTTFDSPESELSVNNFNPSEEYLEKLNESVLIHLKGKIKKLDFYKKIAIENTIETNRQLFGSYYIVNGKAKYSIKLPPGRIHKEIIGDLMKYQNWDVEMRPLEVNKSYQIIEVNASKNKK